MSENKLLLSPKEASKRAGLPMSVLTRVYNLQPVGNYGPGRGCGIKFSATHIDELIKNISDFSSIYNQRVPSKKRRQTKAEKASSQAILQTKKRSVSRNGLHQRAEKQAQCVKMDCVS